MIDEREGDVDPQELEGIPDRGHHLEVESLLEPIRSLMRTRVAMVSPDSTVLDAVLLMARGHFGCVLVVEEDRLVGILSERDVVARVLAERHDPTEARVGNHMTRNPETLCPDHELAYALHLMAVRGFRHVPITDAEGKVAGILSLRDLGGMLLDHFREEILTLPPHPDLPVPKRRHGG